MLFLTSNNSLKLFTLTIVLFFVSSVLSASVMYESYCLNVFDINFSYLLVCLLFIYSPEICRLSYIHFVLILVSLVLCISNTF